MLQTITITNMDRFTGKLANLQKRAEKLGFPAVEATCIHIETTKTSGVNQWGELIETGVCVEYTYEIVSDTLILPGGWKLVAVTDHRENLVNVVPGEVFPPHFRDRGPVCDHCKMDRLRSETFVVRNNNGSFMQVGRTCLGDFLGITPSEALQYADFYVALTSGWDEERGLRLLAGYDLQTFLAYAIMAIREYGWVSKSNSNGRTTTATRAWDEVTEPLASKRTKVSVEDMTEAQAVVDWAVSLPEDSVEYLRNLRQISVNAYVTYKSQGYAASMVVARQKDLNLKSEQAAQVHLGTVGEKLTVEATLINSPSHDSMYGTTFFHLFKTECGNLVKWKTGTSLELGKRYRLIAKVDDHAEFRGVAETVIKRPKWERLD